MPPDRRETAGRFRMRRRSRGALARLAGRTGRRESPAAPRPGWRRSRRRAAPPRAGAPPRAPAIAARRRLANEQAATRALRASLPVTVHEPSIRASRPGIESKRRSVERDAHRRRGLRRGCCALRRTPKRADQLLEQRLAQLVAQRAGPALLLEARPGSSSGRRTSHCGWSTCAGTRIGSSATTTGRAPRRAARAASARPASGCGSGSASAAPRSSRRRGRDRRGAAQRR